MSSFVWSILEGPLLSFALGIVLTVAALLLFPEYRRLFMVDRKSAMSIEVLMLIATGGGGPGFLVAFLLFAALLSFACGLFSLVFNVSRFLSR
jgi:hypothetical protein